MDIETEEDKQRRALVQHFMEAFSSYYSEHEQPTLIDWDWQKEIDLLVSSGFAVFREDRTDLWRRDALQHGKPTYHRCYYWTPEGREACFRYQHSTPMAWAIEMYYKRARHCVVCGRDCYHKKVWAHSGAFLCVCMACGAKGHGLADL
jgi:hypothetical protein